MTDRSGAERKPVTVYPFKFMAGAKVKDRTTGMKGRIFWRYKGHGETDNHYTLGQHGIAAFAEKDLVRDGLVSDVKDFLANLIGFANDNGEESKKAA